MTTTTKPRPMVSTIVEIVEVETFIAGFRTFELHDYAGRCDCFAVKTYAEAVARRNVRRGVLRAMNTRRANKNRRDGF